jgi:hypothetical protein
MTKNAIHVPGFASRRREESLVMESKRLGKRKHVHAADDCIPLLSGNVSILAPDVDEFVVHVSLTRGVAWKKTGQCPTSQPMEVLDVPGSESMLKTTCCYVS